MLWFLSMTGSIPRSLNANRKIYVRAFLVAVPLIVGTLIYLRGRKYPVLFETWFYQTKETSSLPGSGWIPDYLWCVSLWTSLVWLWNGWTKIPIAWKWLIWLMVMSTELFQWKGWIHGTGDWIDLIMYQMAFITIYIFQKTELI